MTNRTRVPVALAVLAVLLSCKTPKASEGPRIASGPPFLHPLLWTTDEEMHRHFLEAFIKAPGFGVARMPFLPVTKTDELSVSGTRFHLAHLTDLRLIGIAMHTPPMSMPAGSNHASTTLYGKPEPLDPFDSNAVEELRRGQDLVALPGRKERRVLGAIRARQDCLGCHPGSAVGTLLGAFSYRLAASTQIDGAPKKP